MDNKANSIIKDKSRECRWVKDRDRVRDLHDWRSKGKQLVDLGDLEWVGGWSEHLHM